jgi:hypothetical protein
MESEKALSRLRVEQQSQLIAQSRSSPEDEDRNRVLFDQHRRMNDLQIAKLSAEVELLTLQLKNRPLDADRLDAGKEYHELLVEKTKLEMDSLRLHIAELRKRLADDWNAS